MQALVDTGRVLPVIDGLDEMDAVGQPPVRCGAALARFNENPRWGRALVVTCRAAVYTAATDTRDGEGIHGCRIVAPRALSVAEINDHVQTLLEEDDRIPTGYARRLTPLLEPYITWELSTCTAST